MARIGAAVVAVVLAATALLAGCAAPNISAPPLDPPRATTSTITSTITSTTASGAAVPAEIVIPRIEVSSSLVGLGLAADGTVEVPPVEEPMQAGWFAGAPKPGEPGPAVVLGHVNGGGQAGVFARLHELAEGDEVLTRRTDGTAVRFTVTRVDQVPKADFPTEEVYGDTADPELRLITCGGTFDRTADSYRDNVIVYAVLADRP